MKRESIKVVREKKNNKRVYPDQKKPMSSERDVRSKRDQKGRALFRQEALKIKKAKRSGEVDQESKEKRGSRSRKQREAGK